MSNICLNLNNYIEISNNNYTLNGNNNVSEYGLYDTSGNIVYSITNIPKKYPLGFYSLSDPDVSNMITYDPSYGTPIKIYVSKGSDMSFNNGNYFRLDMNAFQPERHYRVLYRIVSGSGTTRTDQFIDKDFIFKVSR